MNKLTVLLVTSMLALVAPVQAFDVNPVVSVIEIPGDGAGITLTLRNPRKEALPVSFEIVERRINEDGSESTQPADDQFVIFPPQAVVAPGKSQAIRVQWIGAAPQTSRSFTLFAAEEAVDLTERKGASVQTVFRIGASVHVAAKKSVSKPVLLASAPAEKGVTVTLGNEGDRYYYVDETTLTFGDKKIGGFEVGAHAVRTLVPPGARRSFVIPDVSGTPKLGAAAR